MVSQVALVVKNPPANAGDAGSIPVLGRFPGGGHGNPFQYSCLENLMDRLGKQRGVGCLLCVKNCHHLRDKGTDKTRKELGMTSLVKRRIEAGRQTFLFLWKDCHSKEGMDSF